MAATPKVPVRHRGRFVLMLRGRAMQGKRLQPRRGQEFAAVAPPMLALAGGEQSAEREIANNTHALDSYGIKQ